MRRIALHEYLSQVEGLLDDNRLPEAAAHCHFILQQYPRHIATYRLFGRALLEQQLYDEAVDVFERLLSADPEDLVSHAGLALAHKEGGDLDRSIWHMERAFEIDPYNRAVQDELRKLYIARNGDAPARLSLTQAALARLHLKASLYHQAVEDFSQLIITYPERIDLQLGLADTLYWSSRVTEAAEWCQTVLKTLPFCIKANAIVADARLRGDQVEEARQHLSVLQALTMLDRPHLDPDTTLGRTLSNPRISIPDAVQVEVLEDTMAFAREFEESGAWPSQATTLVVDNDEMPDWLHDVDEPEIQTISDQPMATMLDETSGDAEIADWLEDALSIADPAEPASATIESVDSEQLGESAIGASSPIEIGEAEHLEQTEGIDGVVKTGVQHGTSEATIADATLADDKPADDVQVTGAPGWDEESLLALNDLRAYIDADSDPAESGTGAPEWLAELPDGSEVADELPKWLYEAVGLDVTAQDSRGLQDSILQDEARPTFEEPLGGPGAESDFPPQSDERSDLQEDLSPGGWYELESTAERLSSGSKIPDWLLEGDDVLDELPADLLAAAPSGASREGDSQDDPDVWLDELAAQLGGLDLQTDAAASPAAHTSEDKRSDTPPAERSQEGQAQEDYD